MAPNSPLGFKISPLFPLAAQKSASGLLENIAGC